MRLRPVPGISDSSPDAVCRAEHRIITLQDPSKGHNSEFVFDRVFGASADQEEVFSEAALPLVEHAMQVCAGLQAEPKGGQGSHGQALDFLGWGGVHAPLNHVCVPGCRATMRAASLTGKQAGAG